MEGLLPSVIAQILLEVLVKVVLQPEVSELLVYLFDITILLPLDFDQFIVQIGHDFVIIDL